MPFTDPSIILGAKSPEGPLQTMQQMYSLRNAQQQQQALGMENQQRAITLKNAQQDDADQAAFRAELGNGGSLDDVADRLQAGGHRSEERRVGKECRSRWSP